MNQPVYDKLISSARARKLVSYTDLATAADLDVTVEGHIKRLRDMLDEIAIHEVRAGRPLLPIL